MDYENFKEQFVADVKDRLAEQGADVKVSVNEVNKLNESYEAITVTPEGSNIGVNMSLEKFYDAVQDGTPYDSVVDKAVDVINNGIDKRPEIDVAALTDYSQMKEKLAMEVVSAETNKDMLQNVPHQNMEDMAVVYRFVLNSDEDGRASILVTNQILDHMGVTPEQLHADALENAPQIKPAEIKGMSEVMAELLMIKQATLSKYESDEHDVPTDVLSLMSKVLDTTPSYLVWGSSVEEGWFSELKIIAGKIKNPVIRDTALKQMLALAQMDETFLP